MYDRSRQKNYCVNPLLGYRPFAILVFLIHLFTYKLNTMEKKFEIIFHMQMTDITNDKFGFDTNLLCTMKGEFEMSEVEAIKVAAIAEFILHINEKLEQAIKTGYRLS